MRPRVRHAQKPAGNADTGGVQGLQDNHHSAGYVHHTLRHMDVGLSFLHDTSPLVNKIGRTIDQFLLLAISRIIDIVYYGYSMIRFTTGDMTGLLGIIRLVMFSNDYQKKEMISYD